VLMLTCVLLTWPRPRKHKPRPRLLLASLTSLRAIRLAQSVTAIRSISGFITARRYVSAVYAVVMRLSVRPSVCISVRHNPHCTKTAKHRITTTIPYDSPGTLVFWCQRSQRNSNGITPTGAPNRGGVGLNGDFRPISCYISEAEQDRDILTMER